MPTHSLSPSPGGNASVLDIDRTYVVKQSPGTLATVAVTTAGSTTGYAADALIATPDPILSSVSGGSLGGATYYARIAYTDATGAVVGTLSEEKSQVVASSHLLQINSPPPDYGVTGWLPFVAVTAGGEIAQTTTPIPIGTNWTEPTSGLIDTPGGDALPVSDTTHLLPPSAPVLSEVVSGALGARDYFAKITYLNPLGQTLASAESTLHIDANNVLKVMSPGAYANADHYNVGVSTTTGTETIQNVAPIALGTDWQEPTSGLITGAALPGSDSTHLLPPAAPALSDVSTDADIVGQTYYGKTTYLNALGETLGSAESTRTVADKRLLKVASPIAYANAAHWNNYVANEAGKEILQNSAPIALGTDWTMPTTGLIDAASEIEQTRIAVIPNTVGETILEWPCQNGIVIVPGAGQVVSVSYQ